MSNQGSKFLQGQLQQVSIENQKLRQQVNRLNERCVAYQQQVLGICSGSWWKAFKSVQHLRKFWKEKEE